MNNRTRTYNISQEYIPWKQYLCTVQYVKYEAEKRTCVSRSGGGWEGGWRGEGGWGEGGWGEGGAGGHEETH
jgi:hypothetical protein